MLVEQPARPDEVEDADVTKQFVNSSSSISVSSEGSHKFANRISACSVVSSVKNAEISSSTLKFGPVSGSLSRAGSSLLCSAQLR